jgi:hypothetical protein
MSESDRPTNELVVTPSMRRAGASVLGELSGVVSSEYLAEAIYTAMAHEEI